MRKYISLVFAASFLSLVGSLYSQTTIDPPFLGDTVGYVNGKAITRKAYVDMFHEICLEMNHGKSDSLVGKEIVEAHNKTWDRLVLGAVIEDSIEKKGIIVTDIEVRSSLESDPPEFLKRQFTDSTGKFIKEAYLKALHDSRNAAIMHTVIESMKSEMRKQKLSNVLIASITPCDEELWKEYKEKKGDTRQTFESEKEHLRSEKLKIKEPPFFEQWVSSAKTSAKIIDYRTIK